MELTKEDLLEVAFHTRPLKAARMALGDSALRSLLAPSASETRSPEEILASTEDTPARVANLVSQAILGGLAPLPKEAEFSPTYEDISGEGSQEPQGSSSKAALMPSYKPQAGPKPATGPNHPGSLATKLAYVDEATIAALGYAPDLMALNSGNIDRDDRFLNPNQALSLAGAASGAYLINSLRSSSQANKRLKRPLAEYIQAVNSGSLSGAKLRELNQELSLLGAPTKLKLHTNPALAEATALTAREALASQITRSRLKAVAPVAGAAALASLIYNNLAPRSLIHGPANQY